MREWFRKSWIDGQGSEQDAMTFGVDGPVGVAIVAGHGASDVLHGPGKLFEHGVLIRLRLLDGG